MTAFLERRDPGGLDVVECHLPDEAMNLLLKRAPDFRGDHYDVLADDKVVGPIMLSDAARPKTPWVWNLEDQTPTHGKEATREAAIAGVRQELAQGSVRRRNLMRMRLRVGRHELPRH
jgi:hypothetical protein